MILLILITQLFAFARFAAHTRYTCGFVTAQLQLIVHAFTHSWLLVRLRLVAFLLDYVYSLLVTDYVLIPVALIPVGFRSRLVTVCLLPDYGLHTFTFLLRIAVYVSFVYAFTHVLHTDVLVWLLLWLLHFASYTRTRFAVLYVHVLL